MQDIKENIKLMTMDFYAKRKSLKGPLRKHVERFEKTKYEMLNRHKEREEIDVQLDQKMFKMRYEKAIDKLDLTNVFDYKDNLFPNESPNLSSEL